jgi:hypothetical protein
VSIDCREIDKSYEEWIQPMTTPQDWITAITATVMPAAINPYSTALVTPANTRTDVLRGYRKIELATALPPVVFRRLFAAKTRGKTFPTGETAGK